ncbi:hypothetical protein Tco_0823766 [Tanacetum coccineum]|uniref:Reverse transcriptase domain-containing protein n=1 Tax=Tanacetum coccineum TaxID=301880 RepID=A0ABQ5ALH9_9ASTR
MKKKQYRRRAQIALEEKNQKSNGFGMTRYATMKYRKRLPEWDNGGACSWFSVLNQASDDFVRDGRIVWVEVEGIPFKLWSEPTFKRIATKWGQLMDVVDDDELSFHSKRLCILTKVCENILESFKIVFRSKVYWLRANEDMWYSRLDLRGRQKEEVFVAASHEGLPTTMNKVTVMIKRVWKVLETVFNVPEGQKDIQSDDPFGIYQLLNKDKNNRAHKVNEEVFLDEAIDKGNGSEELVQKRLIILNKIQQISNTQMSEVAQKAKIKWVVEGDENTKFFHGMLNKKRSQSNIRGIMANGSDNNPEMLKTNSLIIFRCRFDNLWRIRARINICFPNVLSNDQRDDLDRMVTKEEVKRAVWDCGIDKSPGPDGFSFSFFCHFWTTIKTNVFEAVVCFFTQRDMPNGCNSNFIALIPKIIDANMVKDFRPISLIGCLYKIIAKILTNRLVSVIEDLVNEEWSSHPSFGMITGMKEAIKELYPSVLYALDTYKNATVTNLVPCVKKLSDVFLRVDGCCRLRRNVSSYREWLAWVGVSFGIYDKIERKRDNRPPMLEKSMYNSWQSRMKLYIRGKEHGKDLIDSVLNGPFQYGTIVVDDITRPRTYEELTDKEKIREECDIRATNIVLQGLPPDVYNLVNHHTVAKEIWDRVKLLMEGTKMSLQEHECKLYNEFNRFTSVKGETINEYYLRFAQLIIDMNTIGMSMQKLQVNTKFVNNLQPEWSKFVTDVKLARDMHESNFD